MNRGRYGHGRDRVDGNQEKKVKIDHCGNAARSGQRSRRCPK